MESGTNFLLTYQTFGGKRRIENVRWSSTPELENNGMVRAWLCPGRLTLGL